MELSRYFSAPMASERDETCNINNYIIQYTIESDLEKNTKEIGAKGKRTEVDGGAGLEGVFEIGAIALPSALVDIGPAVEALELTRP